MNFYTLAAKINKKIFKETYRARTNVDNRTDLTKEEGDELVETVRDTATKIELADFEKNARLGIELMLKFKEIAAEEGLIEYEPVKRNWFITIRPDTKIITFEAFYDMVQKFVKRSCFINYTLSFEQKGTSDETLGQGFHTHIVAQMTQRSKGEVLRDTQSTFKKCTAKNCIQVLLCKNPEELIDSYLINYESNDEHKIVTKIWDTKWREKMNLKEIYSTTRSPTCLIKSE